MVTYADVQSLCRREKASIGLQKMDDGFYREVCELLASVGDEHKGHIEKLSGEIFERRRNKIVVCALRPTGKEPENMVFVERSFYTSLVRTLSEYGKKVFAPCDEEIAKEAPAGRDGIDVEKVEVRFINSIPSIIGVDMVHYGPFKEGDTARLPVGNAKVLVEQDVAEEV
ncbi:MAG: hypothetical protein JW724_00690 [Candidatus Altiarchaeota archaeon]|nr:hypothetical protein [Candidatus Altiarchaeota archaeon]